MFLQALNFSLVQEIANSPSFIRLKKSEDMCNTVYTSPPYSCAPNILIYSSALVSYSSCFITCVTK